MDALLLKSGWGYQHESAFGLVFKRATADIPCRYKRPLKPGYVIVTDNDGRTLHVASDALEVATVAA